MIRPARRALAALAALAALVLFSGCRPSVEIKLAPLTAIPADDGKWPEAKAVIEKDDTHLIVISSHDTSYSEWRIHRVIRLRSADVLDLADLRIELSKSHEISDFKARSIAADGTVRTIDESALKSAPVEAEDDTVAEVFVASIPGAEVGGVIEYTYAVEAEYARRSWLTNYRGLTGTWGLPIRKARMKVTVNKFVRYSVQVTRTASKIRKEKDGLVRHIVWEAEDIGPARKEKWAPPDDGWPRFLFKVQAFATKTWRLDVTRSWDAVLRWRVRTLHGKPERLYEKYEPVEQPECAAGDVMCRIAGALDIARQRVAFDGLVSRFGRVRPLHEMLAAGTANQYEKAVFVGKLLRDAGVEVRYAFGVRPATQTLDVDYPYAADLNHMLLYVPKQQGLDKPLWLDAACEYCTPGQLSDYSRGARMLLTDYDADDDKVSAKVTRAGGEAPLADRARDTYTVTLSPTGDAEIRYEELHEGNRALWFARTLRKQDDEARRKAAESVAAAIDARAELVDAPTPTCDAAAGRCTRVVTVSVPGLAVIDGDEVVLPLKLLADDGIFEAPKKKRTRRLKLTTTRIFEEALVLKLPDGFSVAGAPTPFTASSDAFETALTVEQTPDGLNLLRRAAWRQGMYPAQPHDPRVDALRKAAAVRDTPIRLRRIAPAAP